MALLAIEGFDDGFAQMRYPTVSFDVDAAYGYTGKGARVGDNHSRGFAIKWSGMTADTTITLGCRVNIQIPYTARGYVLGFSYLSANSGYEATVMVDPDTLQWVVRDRTDYTYGEAGAWQPETWYYVELQFTKANSPGGSWELRVDGVTILSASSRDTYYGVDGYAVIGGQDTSDQDSMYIDDVYLLDSTGTTNNDFLGICKVETDLPSGNGDSSVLLGSDGNSTDNYLLVDNNASVPPATTEYVESDTEGDKDTYAMSDLDGTATVYGVQTTLYAAKDDSGAKFVRPVIRSGGTDYAGTSSPLSLATFIPVDEIWDVDPNTSAAWGYAAVNAMEVGPEVRDS